MKKVKTGQEKIQEICHILRVETLEPAQQEGERIIEEAKKQAEEIITAAKQQADAFHHESKVKIEQERAVLNSSLIQAKKQALESLRQAIETQLFQPELHRQIIQATTAPKLIAEIISSIVKAIQKDGLKAEVEAVVPQTVSAKDIADALTGDILNKLKGQKVNLGPIAGGAQIRLEGKNLMIDISDKELQDLLSRYVRKDFRKYFFASDQS